MAAEEADSDSEENFSAFSVPPHRLLRSLFTGGVCHSLHTLALSTVRLSKDTCQLLSSLLFLIHLELRLFEFVADEWHTDFLSSPSHLSRSGVDSVLLHSAVNHSSMSRGVSDVTCSWPRVERGRSAVQACGRALCASVRRLCHLRSLTVVDYVDEVDSDDWPSRSGQSEGIIAALSGHPHLERLQLVRPLFSSSTLFGSSLSSERLCSIPHLRSVELVDTAQLPAAQCEALLTCSSLTEVQVRQTTEKSQGAASTLFAPHRLRRAAQCWPELRVLVAEGVRVQREDEVVGGEGVVNFNVTPYFTALASFPHLTAVHLSFLPPFPTTTTTLSSSQSSSSSSLSLSSSFTVDESVWDECWQPDSPLALSLLHLTLPTFPSCPMSALLHLPPLLHSTP